MHIYQPLAGVPVPGRGRVAPLPQAGFSLVELMIALTIGLVVSLAVMMGYLAAAQAQRGETDVTRVQESARFAMDLFGRESRNAAFRENAVAPGTVSGGAETFNSAAAGTGAPPGYPNQVTYLNGYNDGAVPTLPDGSTPTIINKGDSIVFRYYGNNASASATVADGTILNCTGVAVAYGNLNEDTLFIARDSTNTVNDPLGEPTLFCSTKLTVGGGGAVTNGAPVPLIPGVESLQILYGEDFFPTPSGPGGSDGIVDHYVPPASLAYSDFSAVRSLMVSMVVRSPTLSGFTAAQTFNHFGVNYAPGNAAPSGDTGSVFNSITVGASASSTADARIRRLYNTMFALRNVL
jgi:type IV pilus assembly protein PilW